MKHFLFTILLTFTTLVYGQNKEIPITEFSQELKEEGILLDVRTPGEFAAGHLDGAINIDWFAKDFASRLGALNLDRKKKIYVYCQKGGRSSKAAKLIDSLGYTDVTDLIGGYDRYNSHKR